MLAATSGWRAATPLALVLPSLLAVLGPMPLAAQESGIHDDVTFSRDIAPILQRSCQDCHHRGGVAPMSLVTYEEVRNYAPRIARRTAIRDRMGAMPPWYVEKDVGIQHFKDDPSLSDDELALIQTWARSGAPEGDPADLPPPREFTDGTTWTFGEPDLVVSTDEILVEGDAPDWWGNIEPVPVGLTQDRYVRAVEIREVNDFDPAAGHEGRHTVGGRFVVHHMIWSTRVLDGQEEGTPDDDGEGSVGWPVHEVGRNPDIFDPDGGRLLKANSSIVSNSVHLHSNGRDTRARLEVGFYLHPPEYQPKYRSGLTGLGNAVDIDIRAGEGNQELHAYNVLTQHTKIVSFEPHLHAPGTRMCLEAIWGYTVETLSCVGYDHNWVRGYTFEDDYQPLLPKGAVLHIVGYMDLSDENPNVPDTRNWQGSGNRSVANMFIDLGQRATLTDEQFVEEMARRRERLDLEVNDHVIGCPLCLVIPEGRVIETAGTGSGSRSGNGGR
jgi:hypothetical protein